MRSDNVSPPNSPTPIADRVPVGDAELGPFFDVLAERKAVGLAVSGGADSLALMLLAERWRSQRAVGPALWVFTVDHGLRPTSAAEAGFVAATARRLGLQYRILHWDGPKPTTGVEEAAREARYRLLLQAAEEVGASDLLTAHHRDDQVETVLMRLGRGSGLGGLAAMRGERALGGGVTLRRPLLGVPKARLAATVAAAGLTPVEDESNADRRFARARLRSLTTDLTAAGVDAAGVARSAVRLARADDALEHYVDELLDHIAVFDRFAVATIDRAGFGVAPVEVRLRALARIVGGVGGSDWPPPRGERLEALEQAIVTGGRFKRTLAGTVILASDEVVTICREGGRRALPHLPVSAGDSGIWDGRFAFRIKDGPEGGLSIGPLGEPGRRSLGLKNSSPAALATLPALRLDADIVAVPPAGIWMAGTVSIAVDIHSVLERKVRG
jgi:tRNA(Ile)-lysidine synthase